MSGPETKRPRLSEIDVPSPFENAPDDIIKHIFIRLHDVKTKLRLDLVSKKCQSLITDRACWIRDNTLKIRFGDIFNDFNLFDINGKMFGHDKVRKALDILLKRINVHFIDFDDLPQGYSLYNVMMSMCKTLLENKESMSIQSVKISAFFDKNGGVGTLLFMNTLLAMDLAQVRKLEFSATDPPVAYKAFYPFVLRCPNLKEFKICISLEKNAFGGMVVLENCPYVERLEIFSAIGINRETEKMLIKICNDHSFIKSLHFKCVSFDNNRELAFVQSLSDETRFRIQSFSCELDPEIEEHRDLFINILRFFPNMKNLSILCHNPVDDLLPEAVDIFMHHLAGRVPYVFNIELSNSVQHIRQVIKQLKRRVGPAVTVKVDKEYIKCSKGNIQLIIEYEKY